MVYHFLILQTDKRGAVRFIRLCPKMLAKC